MILASLANCSLLSHLSAAGEAVQTRPRVACNTRIHSSLQSLLQTHRFEKETSIHLREHRQKSTMLARLARRTRRTVRLLSDDAAPAVPPQRIVVAVGGNALQRRGDRLTIENMLKAAKQMVRSRRPVVLGWFHFIQTTRGHLTMTWVVSFSSLRPFGPAMLRAGALHPRIAPGGPSSATHAWEWPPGRRTGSRT